MKQINELKEGNSFLVTTEAPELAAFVEDFYKRYTSLYERYDQLLGEIRKKAHHRDKTDGSSSSSSSSDSESEHISVNKGKTGEHRKDEAGEWVISVSEHQTLLEQIRSETESYKLLQAENVGLKQELDTAKQHVDDLNQRLRTVDEEKDSLMLHKTEEMEQLRIESERLKEHNLKLHVEYGDLKLLVDASMQQLAAMDQRLTTVNEERDALFSEKSMALINIQQSEKKIEDLGTEARLLEDNNSKLLGENEGLKLELESANQILQATSKEKDTLAIENMEVLSKLQKAEKIIEEYRTEMRLLKDEISELRVENGSSKLQTEGAIQEVSELKKLLTASNSENDSLTSKNLALLSKVQEEEKMIEKFKIKAEQLKGDISKLQANNEDLKHELESVNQHVSDLKQMLQEKEENKVALALENSAALNRLQQMENNIEKLKNELYVVQTGLKDQVLDLEGRLEQKRGEISTFQKKLEDAQNDASGQNRALTSQISELQLELDLLRTQKSELEDQIVRKTSEASEIQNQMDKLKVEFTSKISEQQKMLSERENCFGELNDNYKQLEDQFHATCEKLQITENKIKEMGEENQLKILHVNDLQLELDLLRTQKSELECQIERKNNEAIGTQIEMEKLNHQVTAKISDCQRILKEKEGSFDELHANYKKLENQFQELFEKFQLAEEKIKEMAEKVQQKEAQVNDHQLELDTMRSQKSTLEGHITRKTIEASETLLQMEKLNHELTSKISDLQRTVENQEHNFDELHTKYTLLYDQFQGSCEKLHIEEKRHEEIGDEHKKIVESKDETIRKMQMVSDENKKEIETAGEEIVKLRAIVCKLEENCIELRENFDLVQGEKAEMSKEKEDLLQSKDERIGMLQKTEAEQKEAIARLEVQLRLSNRKLQITETEFKEKEENYLKMHQNLQEEYKLLEVHTMRSSEKTGLLEKELSEIKEVAEFAMKNLDSGLCEVELMAHKFEEKHNNFITRLSNWSKDLQIMKNWAAAIINEKKELKEEMCNVTGRLEENKVLTMMLSEKLRVLKMQVRERDEEKAELLERVLDFDNKMGKLEKSVKEKEAKIMDREEEKREAIRQLCLWIEYHRENQNHLRQLLLAMRERNRQPPS